MIAIVTIIYSNNNCNGYYNTLVNIILIKLTTINPQYHTLDLLKKKKKFYESDKKVTNLPKIKTRGITTTGYINI
jgi:hypothetical protein